MSSPSSSPRIVVAVDGSDDARHAVRWVSGVASALPGAAVHLIEAVTMPAIPADAWARSAESLIAEVEAEAHERLSARRGELRAAGIETEIHLRRWLAAEAILELAVAENADLIVLGRRGRSARQALLGSVSGEVSRQARIPVAIVRGDSPAPPRRMLVALDGSEPSRVAAGAALRLFPSADVVAISVRDGDEGLDESGLAAELERLGGTGRTVRYVTMAGPAAATLLNVAAEESVDLVCAGRRGHGLFHELFVGSVAEKLLQLAPCPILLAH